ncbi:MAG: hypothetical protein ACI8QZ_002000 [Chlamydiales bacterium]|jgi:uncharacterized protein YdhG (YjbR/CyaY superfamily)
MTANPTSVRAYIDALPDERKPALKKLRQVLKKHLPKGFKEVINYGMPSFVVPHSTYPDGYHCDPTLPLPFLGYASQKNFVALYHMGIYADPKLLAWFEKQWPKHVPTKLDMGKSCIRFKKMDAIPFELVGQLAAKMTVEKWVALYEKSLKR